MKTCTKCGNSLSINSFGVSRARKDGLNAHCNPCRSAYRESKRDELRAKQAEYFISNRVARNAANRAYSVANKDKRAAYNARYYEATKEPWREKDRTHKLATRGQVYARNAAYRARKLGATPVWADLGAIAAVYAQSARLSRSTGVVHHVDHIVPLNHPLVCGLNVSHNLQVIPATENLRKSNRFEVM